MSELTPEEYEAGLRLAEKYAGHEPEKIASVFAGYKLGIDALKAKDRSRVYFPNNLSTFEKISFLEGEINKLRKTAAEHAVKAAIGDMYWRLCAEYDRSKAVDSKALSQAASTADENASRALAQIFGKESAEEVGCGN